MKNRWVVMTGGLGYIGRNAAVAFERSGWRVCLIVRPQQPVSPAFADGRYTMIRYDGSIESLDSLRELDAARTVFLHLAASSVLNDELHERQNLLQSNIVLGTDLVASMMELGFRKILHTESYWQFDKWGSLGGNSLYAATKSSFSLLFEYFCRRYVYGIALVLYDVYGPDDSRGKLLSSLVSQGDGDQALELTPGEQTLDYIHVTDVVNALLAAGHRLLAADSSPSFARFTVRSMRPMTLQAYVSLMERTLSRQLRIRWGARPYPAHQIMDPWLPDANAQLPGWQAAIRFEDGIRELNSHD